MEERWLEWSGDRRGQKRVGQITRESSRHSSLNCPPWLMARLEVEDEKVPGQECQGVFRSERKALRSGMMVKAR